MFNSEPVDPSASLAAISPKDKPWDTHKHQAEQVTDLYQGTDYHRYADRMDCCGRILDFAWLLNRDTGELSLKLRACRFCRCRNCPICQWRRALMWVARFLKALPAIQADFPQARYIFITLTVKTCPLEDLRATVKWMKQSWERMRHRKGFPLVGFAISTEVTRSADGYAHPHFHILGMVQPGYFKTPNYWSQAKWTEVWQSCLGVDYTPVVHVRAVKPNPKRQTNDSESALQQAILETFKYTVKPDDLLSDREWLVGITQQLHKTRSVSLGGHFLRHLSEDDPEDLIGASEGTEELLDGIALRFGWQERCKLYLKLSR